VGDLVDVAADGAYLGDAALQRNQLLSGQRGQSPQVRPDQIRDLGCRRNLPGLRSLSQQQQVIGTQAHRYLAGRGDRLDGAGNIGFR
jgi:hypothetical protein